MPLASPNHPNSPAVYPVQLHLVSPATGLIWFKQGLAAFFRQPLALGVLFFMAVAFFQLLSYALSVFGLLAWVMLTPAVNVGFMAAMADVTQSRVPTPKRLITGFLQGSGKTKSLLMLGGLYVAGLFLLAALAGLLFGGELAAMAKASQEALGASSAIPAASQSASAVTAGPEATAGLLGGFFWLFMAVGIPVTMLTWHAPALVFWYGISPVKALFFSAVACWRNLGAMLVYFLTWVVITASVLLASSLMQGQGQAAGMNFFLMALVAPLSLALGAAFTLSSYFTFQGSFVQHASIP